MDISQADEDAAGWVINLSSAKVQGIPLSREELERYEAWRAADPTHEKAFIKAKRIWDALDVLRGTAEDIEKQCQKRRRSWRGRLGGLSLMRYIRRSAQGAMTAIKSYFESD